MVTREEIEKGNIKKEAKIPFISGKAAIFDPSHVSKLIGIPLQCPILAGELDICADCGNVYCTRIEKHVGQVQAEMPKGSLGFGKGKGD